MENGCAPQMQGGMRACRSDAGRTPRRLGTPVLFYRKATGPGSRAMKSFLAACVVAIIVAVVGSLVLDSVQKPVDEAFKTEAVRLGT